LRERRDSRAGHLALVEAVDLSNTARLGDPEPYLIDLVSPKVRLTGKVLITLVAYLRLTGAVEL
jgi:hypothetical protein